MIYIENRNTDPAYNLAIEQHFFENMSSEESCFMLWQNRPSVIIGRYQNTMEEINDRFIRERGIRVVRRMTGGGAVYHDLGNLNYSFITTVKDSAKLDFKLFSEPIVNALDALGVKAEVSGRNDILVDGKKVSGTAQHVSNGRVLHHGTLLFDVNFDNMNAALTPNKGKIESDSSKSVRARVTNIRDHINEDIGIDDFWNAIKRHILLADETAEYKISDGDNDAAAAIAHDRYDNWDWNFGLSPACTINKIYRIEGCGTFKIGLNISNACIQTLTLHGDFFALRPFETVIQRLIGCKMNAAELSDALSGVNMSEFIYHLETKELIAAILD